MASDTSLVFNLVARDRVSRALGPVAAKLEAFGTKVGTAVAGVGVAAPYVAAAATGAGGLAAGAVAAGAAVGAFKAAALPQLQAVTEASDVAAAAVKAHEKADLKQAMAAKLAAKGGHEYKKALTAAASASRAAKEAHAATAAQLAALPPATRATAKEFAGLKNDYQKWSDSLAGDTMPIFTRGIQALRAALPSLTPLVKAASGAIGGFVDDVAKGVSSGGFKQWISDFAAAAGPALSSFLTVVKNLAIGVGSLLHAFLPMSAGMTGGLASMSTAFATWAKKVEGSAGFARFLSLASSGKGALANLGAAFVDLFKALAPFMGATTIIAQGLADIIGSVPPGVISALAQAFVAASVGMKAWAIATAIWSGIQRVATAVQWAMNTALLASPITWIIIGIVALVAAIVLIATKTTWFQTAWRVMSSAVAAAWSWLWGKLQAGWKLIASLFTALVGWVRSLPGKIVSGLASLGSKLVSLVTGAWNRYRQINIMIAMAIVNWLRGLPGRVIGAIASLAGRLYNAGRNAWNRFKQANVLIATSVVSWARGVPGRIVGAIGNLGSRLYGAGRALLSGLWSGIKSYASTLYGNVSGVVSKVRDYFPFSPAKVGPFSGRGYTSYSGQALVTDFARGVTSRADTARQAVSGALGGAATAGQRVLGQTPAGARAPVISGGGPVHVGVEFRGSGRFGELLVKVLRAEVADKGGDVQKVLGKGRSS